jgi:hypothetical protein
MAGEVLTREGMHFSQSKNARLLNPSRSEMVEISQGLGLCRVSPTHMCKKKFLSPLVVQGNSEMCVCPCVRVSVCLSPRKSAITFDPADGSSRNFQGRLYSSQVIFGRVTRTPDPSGSGPDPAKRVLREIYLLRGFWDGGVVSHLFGIGRTRPTKCWERNFDFRPWAENNAAGRRGRPGGRPKF